MTDGTFSIMCQVCKREVSDFTQSVKFSFLPTVVAQGAETIYLSCGCVVDFPDWQIDIETGLCKIYNYAGVLFVEFIDDEVTLEGD